MTKQYDTAYKEEVCKMVVEGGKNAAEVARELGINRNTIYTWVQRYRENSEKPFVGSGHVQPENEEVVRLRRANKDLREENEILKKAAAYFAKNQR